MATGHWDPGYGDTVTRLRRAQSALPPGSSLTGAQLEDVRERAKDLWLHPNGNPTSYQDHYKERVLHMSEMTSGRPTSGQRKNRPHPPNVFLTTHLHTVPGYGRLQDIPGYHNPDATLGKDPYKVDRSVPGFEQEYRNSIKSKYIGRANTSAVNQYKTIPELDAIADPIERQGMEAYLKLATKRDQQAMLASLRETRYNDPETSWNPLEKAYRPQSTCIPSLNRYMRHAGAEEAERLRAVSGHYARPRSCQAPDIISMRYRDLEAMKNPEYTHSTKRGDFLIHPEWTPKFQHHRLNGLSSIDIPYYPGRR